MRFDLADHVDGAESSAETSVNRQRHSSVIFKRSDLSITAFFSQPRHELIQSIQPIVTDSDLSITYDIVLISISSNLDFIKSPMNSLLFNMFRVKSVSN